MESQVERATAYETLLAYIEGEHISRQECGRRLGISGAHICQLLAYERRVRGGGTLLPVDREVQRRVERRPSLELAVKIERMTGVPVRAWVVAETDAA